MIVVQDGIEGSRFKDVYMHEHAETAEAVQSWIANNLTKFASINFIKESLGRGTAATAKRAIDYGFVDHDWIIFSEDDLIYEADALQWFSIMIKHDGFLRDDVWAVAGESKHFDSKGADITSEITQEALRTAFDLDLISKYIYFQWLPSSCFATTKQKWSEFADTRGLGRGPKEVNDRCKVENKYSLWPVVARCRDVGMHHVHGYSMTLHKRPDRIPQKSNYIVSSQLNPMSTRPEEFIDKGNLYEKFTTSQAQ